MFQHLSPTLRFLFCMLLSMSLHGGLVIVDWKEEPGPSRAGAAPVLVALLSATDMAPSRTPETVQPSAEPQPPQMTPQAAVPRPARQPEKTANEKPVARARKVLPKQPLPESAQDEPASKVQSSEMICMLPQDVVTERSATLKAELDAVSPGQPGDTEPSHVSMSAAPADRTAGGRPAGQRDLADAVPDYSRNPLPEYPAIARQKHWQGVVWLLVDVSADGSVEELRVEQSCGHRVLDRAASRTVQRWRFTPARRAGLPTASQVRIPVRFRLEDS